MTKYSTPKSIGRKPKSGVSLNMMDIARDAAVISNTAKNLFQGLGSKGTQTAADSVITTKYVAAASKKFKGRKKLSKGKVKFYKKVREVIEGNLGTQLLSYNYSEIIAWLAHNTGTGLAGQNMIVTVLGGPSADRGTDAALVRVFDEVPAVERAEATFNLRSGCMDIVFETITNPNTGKIVDCDIYEYVFTKRVPLRDGSLNLNSRMTTKLAEVQPPTNSSLRTFNQVVTTTLGVTPFRFQLFNQEAKLIGKKKLFIGSGESTHLQYKKRYGNKELSYADCTELVAIPGVTYAYVIVPNNTDWTAGSLTYRTTQTYVYNRIGLKTSTSYTVVP